MRSLDVPTSRSAGSRGSERGVAASREGIAVALLVQQPTSSSGLVTVLETTKPTAMESIASHGFVTSRSPREGFGYWEEQ